MNDTNISIEQFNTIYNGLRCHLLLMQEQVKRLIADNADLRRDRDCHAGLAKALDTQLARVTNLLKESEKANVLLMATMQTNPAKKQAAKKAAKPSKK